MESRNSIPDALFIFMYLLCMWHEQGKDKNIRKEHKETYLFKHNITKLTYSLSLFFFFYQILHFLRHLEFYRDGLFSSNVPSN